MKLRVLASSLALHTGVLVGAAAWAFGPSGGAPRVPGVVRFEQLSNLPAQSLDEQAPMPDFDDVEPIQPDEQVREPSPRPFEPPTSASPPADASEEHEAILPDLVARSPELFASVRAPEAQDTPLEAAPPASQPKPQPSPAPAPAHVEATAVDSHNVPPAYPPRAIRDSHEGTVGLLVSIDETGQVVDVTIAAPCRFPELNRAARDAVRSWRYEPARLDDRPIASQKRVDIVFELSTRRVATDA